MILLQLAAKVFLIILFLFSINFAFMTPPQLLTDPFLQLPTETTVRVVWFTEFPGYQHFVNYGEDLKSVVTATTTKLSHTYEDQRSKVGTQIEEGQVFKHPQPRDIWRHEAEVRNLKSGVRIPYYVTSVREDEQKVSSRKFSLTSQPMPGKSLKILLTSDHQLMPMTSANLQKVVEIIKPIDAIFFAGDLVNIPDRASEWFDDNRGVAFFPTLQGRANKTLNKTTYKGGELIQHIPLFPTVGNHEVMGRFSLNHSLNEQFYDAVPRELASKIYERIVQEINPTNDSKVREDWIKSNSFNTDTYEEIFTLPQNKLGVKNCYAITFGDVRLVVLYLTNIWRSPNLDPTTKGRYQERQQDLHNPDNWGYGQHIFEPVSEGSLQYQWLIKELNSPEFTNSKYKIVMFHHPPHSLGDNIVPAYTNPVKISDYNTDGTLKLVRYEYPKSDDYIIRDVVPQLEAAEVQLVLYGHSHLWNRFISQAGTHYLETSNVGNTYGAALGKQKRPVPISNTENYSATGDPNGLDPVVPNIAPLLGEDNQPLPYLASNEITAFSILDTGTATVSSYYFDTRKPNSEVVKFDEFKLLPDEA